MLPVGSVPSQLGLSITKCFLNPSKFVTSRYREVIKVTKIIDVINRIPNIIAIKITKSLFLSVDILFFKSYKHLNKN